ncbi:hypothetical protein SAMN05216551_10735 [Chitinasiproducens palmae]|uniref:Uncharacterized protein n=2 Tax=Chitinasiproducens palmae TaxID=1770053 RepID=A0A1H2PQH0_9BURK|nr:hypothetical protein SAMN05216551_10735 [Chitinasiproducens palmae]
MLSRPRVFLNLSVSCLALMSAAWAASVVVVPVETASDRFVKYAWVALIASAGWAASSLPVLADWGQGNARRRLVIVQGFAQAMFFGFSAFWASAGADQNLMASYLATAAAAYAGERYFTFGRRKETEPPAQGPA